MLETVGLLDDLGHPMAVTNSVADPGLSKGGIVLAMVELKISNACQCTACSVSTIHVGGSGPPGI